MFRALVKQLSKKMDSPIPLHPCIRFGTRTKELHDLSILRGRQVCFGTSVFESKRTPTLTCRSIAFNFIEYHSWPHVFCLEINNFCCNQCFKPWKHIFSTMSLCPRDKPANRRAKRNMEVLGPSHRSVFHRNLECMEYIKLMANPMSLIQTIPSTQKGKLLQDSFELLSERILYHFEHKNLWMVLNFKDFQYLLPIS